jgi:Spy/CpxP family protein refolding chaperone
MLVAPSLQAQDAKPGDRPRGGGRQDPAERLKMMKEQLSLTDEQTKKVEAVFAKNQDKYKEVRENKDLSQEDRRAKMAELRKAEAEEMKGILTPEQQEKAKKLREERAKQNENR